MNAVQGKLKNWQSCATTCAFGMALMLYPPCFQGERVGFKIAPNTRKSLLQVRPNAFAKRGATMKLLLFVAVLVTVLPLLLPVSASAQGLVYPRPAVQGVPDCVPTWTWSDTSCWYVIGTAPPVSRLPQNGDSATVLIRDIFTLDMNTANLGSLNLASDNASLTGTFLQPGSTLTAASEGVPLFLAFQQNGG